MKFQALLGKIILKIEQLDELELIFYTKDEIYRMFHRYNCSELVYIESIAGDLGDLIGSPILQAEESSNSSKIEKGIEGWTFYKLATIKGYVTIRWNGSSNGYYSIEVDFEKATMEECDEAKVVRYCGFSDRYDGSIIEDIKVTAYQG